MALLKRLFLSFSSRQKRGQIRCDLEHGLTVELEKTEVNRRKVAHKKCINKKISEGKGVKRFEFKT